MNHRTFVFLLWLSENALFAYFFHRGAAADAARAVGVAAGLDVPRYGPQVARLRALMVGRELPIVIGWSFFPIVPTDVVLVSLTFPGARRISR